LRVGQADAFTEVFANADNDLDFKTLSFTPDGSASFYRACSEPAAGFPTDPNGGHKLILGDDGSAEIILAGDTNLPNLSPLLPRYLADYRDGFERAGWGFGYTYPARLPWMRIDRIFASKELRFVSFKTGCDGDSDHRCVFASIERAAE